MQNRFRSYTTVAFASMSLMVAACGHKNDNTAAGDIDNSAASAPAAATPTTATPTSSDGNTTASADTVQNAQHHSKLKGAIIGGIAGHYLGGHAVAGAAAGALVQHERNKHPR